MDPATLLPTGEVVENGLPPAAAERLTEIELTERDFNKFTELARTRKPAASLSQVTNRVLDRSLRHRELKRPNGFDDELRAALVGDPGTWGAITFLREAGRAHFDPADTSLLASLSPYLAEGLRRSILHTALSGEGADEAAVGLVLLEDDNSIGSANAAARAWLDELDAENRLPVVDPGCRGPGPKRRGRRVERRLDRPRPGSGAIRTLAARARIDARRRR